MLVGLCAGSARRAEVEEHLRELSLLADTAGAEVLETVLQARPRVDSSFFIGRGKVREIQEMLIAKKGNVVIFDDELSAGQVRNIQDILRVKVIDRTNLILDIFAKHARTKESKIQVELAQLQYLLPRLTGAWNQFEQQTGGIGTRGPGETQLETDRRLVQKRISDLRARLKKQDRVRQEERKRQKNCRRACLVGYTNAGKSTLMNVLARENVKTEDALFSTLDTTTRRIYLPGAGTVLLSDTVGFIRKLPIHLIESFKSTLQVASEADVLLHVVDASAPECASHMEAVMQTLRELEAENIPMLFVFNKVDLCPNHGRLRALAQMYPRSLLVSAKTATGLFQLKEAMVKFLSHRCGECAHAG